MNQIRTRNTFHFILFFSFLCIATGVFAQTGKRLQKHFDKALLFYKAGNYEMAVQETEDALEHDINFVDAYLLLADIYQEIDSVNLEIENLELAGLRSDNKAIQYRLGQAYYSIGNYIEALTHFTNYIQSENVLEARFDEIQRKIENCNFAIEAMKHPVEFHPIKLSENINTANNEYWPSISLDQKKLVFTRLVKTAGTIAQEDFYYSEFDSKEWKKAQPISEINSNQNEGAQVLSADGSLMFFTACNRPDGKGSCDIYFSKYENGKWTSPKNAGAPLNSNSWEAQPAFSSDNRYLYFSSSRYGGKGAKDIWRSEFKGFDNYGNIKWGEPENLGENINTKGDEISPFIHPNNKNFYFVSDYFTGMGGFDLFTSQQLPNGSFSGTENMGYPINTYKNELGLHITSDGLTAYFSSEREPFSGLDIYHFQLDEKLRPEPVTYIKANITDAKTKNPIEAQIDLVNLKNQQQNRTEFSDKNGELLLCLPIGSDYALIVFEDGYLFFSESFQLSEEKTVYEPYNFDIELKPIEPDAEMNLYNIYFEVDSFSILKESVPELNQLIKFFKNNPGLQVEIQGHTDNTGNVANNQLLSEKRAFSVKNYLIENGVDTSQMQFKGYGHNKPVATNLTEEGRRLNRRTTIKILGD